MRLIVRLHQKKKLINKHTYVKYMEYIIADEGRLYITISEVNIISNNNNANYSLLICS